MQLRCGQCGHTFEVGPGQSGPTVACPRCEHRIAVTLPRAGEARPAGGDARADEDFAQLAVENISRRLRVACGACGKGLSVGMRRAGKRVRCPSCGQWVQIPAADERDEATLARWTTQSEKDSEPLVATEPPVAEAVLEGPPAAVAGEGAARDEIAEDEDVFIIGEAVGREVQEPAESLEKLAKAARGERKPVPARGAQRPVWRRRARRRRRVRRTASWLAYLPILAVAVATALVGLTVWLRMSQRRPPTAEGPAQTPAGLAPTGSKSAPSGKAAASGPAAPGTQEKLSPAAGAPPAPLEIVDVAREMFAAGGYYPASPQGVYWKLRVSVRADKQVLRFHTADDVELLVGEQRLPCLGLPGEGGLAPAQAQAARITVGAGSLRDLTLLFELPSAATPTRLAIRGVGEAALPELRWPPPPAPERILGSYREGTPRNLRPLLRDPVMAAVQAAGDQRLVVRAAGDGFDLQILDTDLAASVHALGGGLYSAAFRLRENTLTCKLRLIGGDDAMILYLSDEPFHQITYVREDLGRQAGK